MMMFAHHMGVELLGREFSPEGVVQHVCVFAAVAFLFGTSAYGTLALFSRVRERQSVRPRV